VGVHLNTLAAQPISLALRVTSCGLRKVALSMAIITADRASIFAHVSGLTGNDIYLTEGAPQDCTTLRQRVTPERSRTRAILEHRDMIVRLNM
jgi:hypothetical protein